MSKTREKFPLSVKKVLKKTISKSLMLVVMLFLSMTAVLAIALTDAVATNMIRLIIIGAVCLIILAVAGIYLYQKWYYAVYFYDLTDDFIIIKKGPITPREITIPYERVQDVYVDQDLMDRLFGLYDVHLSSATISSGMEAHIDGVEKNAADGLRELLLRTVQQKIGKNRQNVKAN